MSDTAVDSEIDSLVDLDAPIPCESIRQRDCPDEAVVMIYYKHVHIRYGRCDWSTQALCQRHFDWFNTYPADTTFQCGYCTGFIQTVRIESLK